MLVDEDEGWYLDLVGETAYDKLLDLWKKNMKKLKVCGRSKPWWSGTIATQLGVVRGYRRGHGWDGDWIRERHKLRNIIQEGKRKYWEDLCTESGEKCLSEVVQWAKDPWRLKEMMGRLRGVDRRWLDSEREKVDGLVSHLFGGDTSEAAGNAGERVECPYNEDAVMRWVKDALSRTKHNSAAGSDGVGYKLIKMIRDTKLGTEVLGEIVAALRGGYIPDR